MKAIRSAASAAILFFGVFCSPAFSAGERTAGTSQAPGPAAMSDAPNVPPPLARRQPAKVIVDLEVKELEGRLADGVSYTFWTFGGKVPGKFIRVREGDVVEIHLHNHPDSKVPHNIDLHAVNGPGGGAPATPTAPGHTSVFAFRALNPGLYVYHCATPPVPEHVANGMYGLILVEPKAGLPRVDHEYYVMQGDFYTQGRSGEKGLQPFSMDKATAEHPDYVVFNGTVGALTGDNALQAKTGETVRLFVGNGGPNLTSSFHVIGEILDTVYQEGNTSTAVHNVQTTLVPAGGAAIVEFRANVPGTYLMVDHSLSRAFNKGALGQIKVAGPEDASIYSGKMRDEAYAPQAEAPTPAQAPAATSKAERIKRGEAVYNANCAACHQVTGTGLPNAVPPLAKSDFLNADKVRAIQVVTGGMEGGVTVNGQQFFGTMPPWSLKDEDIANVLTYVYNNWNNAMLDVTPEEVRQHRVDAKKGQTQ